jgi:hypothetical protein
VTVKLGTYTFVSEPEIVFDLDAELAEKPKYGGGTTLTHVGNGPLRITLTGKLTGANRYADRDTLIGLLKSGSKQEFYADSIGYGSASEPKQVWISRISFSHIAGKPTQLPYTIVLLEET